MADKITSISKKSPGELHLKELINDKSRGTYNANSQIKFKTTI